MSLWHCLEHGLTGPMACCPRAGLAKIVPAEALDERDRGPWTMNVWGDEDDRIVIQSDDFHHDVALEVTGDFPDIESRKRYAIWLAGVLTRACNEAAHDSTANRGKESGSDWR